MSQDATQLYREALLQHARQPRNAGRVAAPSHSARAANPLCGDELELTVAVEGAAELDTGAEAAVREARFQVRGCVIAQAAASLISELLPGRTLSEARTLGATFRQAMEQGDAPLPEPLAALAPLLAVRAHRSRLRCASLAWEAVDALNADAAPTGAK